MDPLQKGNSIFAIQRTTFNHFVDSMKAVLDQNVQIANSWSQTDGEKSGQSMDAATGWSKTMVQNLKTYQKFVNDGFDNLEAFFSFPMRNTRDMETGENE